MRSYDFAMASIAGSALMSAHGPVSRFVSCLGALLLGLGLVAGLDALMQLPISHATNITITTFADELNSDGDCSLREAIQAANTDAAVDACEAGSGSDSLSLPAGTYTLTLVGANEDANATGDLDITDPLTLVGADAATTILDANSLDRVLHVPSSSVTLTLQNLTLRNGHAHSGGGLSAAGPTMVSNTTFTGNTADDGGGGAFFGGASTVTGATFSHNTAAGNHAGGAAFFGLATVTNSTFSNNTTSFSGGGAYFVQPATVVGAAFFNNRAAASGGGAIFVSATTVTNTSFVSNTASYGGGAAFSAAATVSSSTFVRNSANFGGGGAAFFGVFGSARGDFLNILFTANYAGSQRGAAFYAANTDGNDWVTLRHVTIASPTVGSNSAVYVVSGTVSLTNTLVASYSVGLERAGGILSEDYSLFAGVTMPFSGTVVSVGHSLTGTAAFAEAALYRLTIASAARDAGTPGEVTTDFEGQSRGCLPDIGWDEFLPELSCIRTYLPVVDR